MNDVVTRVAMVTPMSIKLIFECAKSVECVVNVWSR